MAEPKPVLKRVRGGFTVTWGPYTTRIQIPLKSSNLGGSVPINALVFFGNGRKQLAHFYGTRSSEIAHLQEIHPNKGVRKTEGLRACGVMLQSLEIALKPLGVERTTGRTHPSFGRFMEQMGYEISEGKTHTDVEKNIKKNGPKLPFRIMPKLAKKKPRKKPAKPKARRR